MSAKTPDGSEGREDAQLKLLVDDDLRPKRECADAHARLRVLSNETLDRCRSDWGGEGVVEREVNDCVHREMIKV